MAKGTRLKQDELIGETTPLDERISPSQVWVNVTGDPIEIIGGCENLTYSISEATDLRRLLGKAIERARVVRGHP